MLKCSSERCVCAPQSLSAGTETSPRESFSMRMFASLMAVILLLPICAAYLRFVESWIELDPPPGFL